MKVPDREYATSDMDEAMQQVLDLTSEMHHFGTLHELQKSVDDTLSAFYCRGGGVEQFKLRIAKEVEKDTDDLAKVVERVRALCKQAIKKSKLGPMNLVNDVLPFVRSTSKILLHGCGELLALFAACAVQQRRGVRFFVTEGLPLGSGRLFTNRAKETPQGFNVRSDLSEAFQLIPDSCVGAVMPQVDFVIMGAHCVTEHGGLVHQTGALQIATVAVAMAVPCYVLCETFKFTKIFPLSTSDLEQPPLTGAPLRKDVFEVPRVEFVPPSMISLVFTEEGIMPPSAVADEMFRMNNTAMIVESKR
jgi:translation initiation factor eIF-2B subunit alpha